MECDSLMPKKAVNEEWKKKRRKEFLEQKTDLFYIFCEGEQTEPNYFKKFKQIIESNPIYKNMVLIKIEGCAAETMRVISQAEDYVARNQIKKGQIWCVFDKDSFPAKDFNGVEKRAEFLNKNNDKLKYNVAWSNECIEYWFILHFDNYSSNNSRTEYIRYLNKKFSDLKIGKYKKNMDNIFDILREHGHPDLAIRYAKRIIDDNKGKTPSQIAPGTKVYELVESLVKYFPEEIKKEFINEDEKEKDKNS